MAKIARGLEEVGEKTPLTRGRPQQANSGSNGKVYPRKKNGFPVPGGQKGVGRLKEKS